MAAEAPHGGVEYRLPDYVTGRQGAREVLSLPAKSRCPSMPWWKRTDPYWNDGLFDAHRPWTTMHKARALYKKTGAANAYTDADAEASARGSVRLRIPDGEAEAEWLRRIAAVLFGCGVSTTEHLVALTGADVSFFYEELADCGIAEYSWHHFPGRPYPRMQVWRLRSDSEQWREYAAKCVMDGHAETMFLGVHPLVPLGPGRHHIRHQVLAVELMLRAMETGDRWAGWLPETACAPSRFCPDTHSGRDDASLMRADGCLVRLDGARVFIEIQAGTSSGKSVDDKIRRWSHLFDSGNISAVVLFVSAARSSTGGTGPQGLRAAVKEHASTAAAKSILVGWWSDYAPDIGQITGDSGTLRAARLDNDEWAETACSETEVERDGGDWHLLTALDQITVTPEWASGTVMSSG